MEIPVKIAVPPQVEWILNRLRENGYEAFAVGGCVRDALLGREPGDWDITTSALPGEVKAVFGRTIDTGLQHGTVTVLRDHVGYEITTYRIDGEYEDGRHPKEVAFTRELREDLLRRDFTINAMAYSHETGIVDVFGGMEDLQAGIIRCVGEARERFTEDALRILRGIRFSAQLGFGIEEKTWEALRELGPGLARISRERIQTEVTKTLLSRRPQALMLAKEAGLEPYLTEHFPRAFDEEAAVRLERSGTLTGERAVRWAAFLAGAGEKTAGVIQRELKMDNDTIRKTGTLIRWLGRELEEREPSLRRAMSAMEDTVFDWLLELGGGLCPEQAAHCDRLREMAGVLRRRGDCIRKSGLAITGNDLLKLGFKAGPSLGRTLDALFEQVLENPEKNERETLLSLAQPLLEENGARGENTERKKGGAAHECSKS